MTKNPRRRLPEHIVDAAEQEQRERDLQNVAAVFELWRTQAMTLRGLAEHGVNFEDYETDE